ncbi:Cytochrome b561 and DOMON domain-containing protein [Camellia lanceoleosa]|uniref:Cytochrome b561 and DOMON domain-containing protein n=1 Tax=Camellia lanceoleosa TaxID=1840588 RepID=A0ACC0GGS4_9ERIC|nr:Cytochrome b561 and DOMON domain-containing protein [Camellia lanceoleosa]
MGINPTSTRIKATQAIVVYQKLDGSRTFYTPSIDSYVSHIEEGKLSSPVNDLSATFSEDQIIIFAIIELPNNTTSLIHVWQDRSITSGTHLGMHDLSTSHLQSMGTLNLSSRQALPSHGSNNKTSLKIVSN